MDKKYRESISKLSLSDESRERIMRNVLDAYTETTNKCEKGEIGSMNKIDNERESVISFEERKSNIYVKVLKYAGIAAVVAVVAFAGIKIAGNKKNTELGSVAASADATNKVAVTDSSSKTDSSTKVDSTVNPEDNMQKKFDASLADNKYFVGMLKLFSGDDAFGMEVAQGETNEQFLYKDINGNDSDAGTVFVDCRCDLESDNVISIFGHNMKDGSRFGHLRWYKDKEFYENNKYIEFCGDTYEVFAAYFYQVQESDSSSDETRYNSSNSAIITKTEKGFNTFISDVNEKKLYETNITPKFGDKMIELITPDYTQKIDNGRFKVLAVKVD